jgi:hypothetical protein
MFVLKTYVSDWSELSSQETNLFSSRLPPAACHTRLHSSYILIARPTPDTQSITILCSLSDVMDRDDLTGGKDIKFQHVS